MLAEHRHRRLLSGALLQLRLSLLALGDVEQYPVPARAAVVLAH